MDSVGLRELVDQQHEDGTWVYPQVRMDLIQIKDNHAEELYVVEGKFIRMMAANDSLEVALIISESKQDEWFDSMEIGMIVGAVIVIFSGWSMGQLSN